MWFPLERKTRRGTVFAAFWPSSATALCAKTFDVAPLMRSAFQFESTYDDDLPDAPSDQELAEAAELRNIDEDHPAPSRSPSPRPKRVRLDDVPIRLKHRKLKRRDARQQATVTLGQAPRAATLRDHILASSSAPIPCQLDATDLPAAHGAYTAKNEGKKEKQGSQKRRSLAELLHMGFRLIPWNGRDSRPIIDAQGRIIAVLAGRPDDPTYLAAADAVYSAMKMEASALHLPRTLFSKRRGAFPALNVGTYYGKGTRSATQLDNGVYDPLLARLLANPHLNRMAVYASCECASLTHASRLLTHLPYAAVFALWAPRVYNHYHERDTELRGRFPHLPRIFPKSVFACAALNFGPDVCTYRHRDSQNAPFGWCSVAALGKFDPTQGGHLVLWDLNLVVEFPPGATILIPSATIAHSNVPVNTNAGEERASFTQYTPGGLLRFVDNNFRTEAAFESEDPEGYARMCEGKAQRWQMGVGLMSTVAELFESE
ncbi:hypothetical protein B0H15DRAFT_958294 [Mycena belliarum]|uniref:Uncharacterized protein n=1 Tax=Mycena belliarum TaxID=1033014 RepID=A0AAD6XFT3_9AGAR|nr:hypothetical protein B0H15DRAFT_958294 [Mycena belliae]